MHPRLVGERGHFIRRLQPAPEVRFRPVDTSAHRTILTGGPVFRPGGPPADAVGIAAGLIVAVGSYADVRAATGPCDEVIDTAGGMIFPGFQDAHVHPSIGGLVRLRCDLTSATNATEGLAVVEEFAAAHPGTGWILGGGWRYPWFERGEPTAELLEGITGRPIWLIGADGHTGWANREALERAGIDRSTPDPPGGVVVRDSTGLPLGALHSRAMDLVQQQIPPDSVDELVAALLEGQRYLLGLGITAWQDAYVEPALDAAYRRIAADGRLKARVRAAQLWNLDRGEEQFPEIVDRAETSVPGYSATAVKFLLDGVVEAQTGAMLAPYLTPAGTPGTSTGVDHIAPDDLTRAVTLVEAAGLQPHFHALGDRAVRNALDALTSSRATLGPVATRPHLSHLQVIDPADIPRFAPLGAVANIQPYWAQNDAAMVDLTLPLLGPERSGLQYPFGSLHSAGARLAMGSDWDVSTADVMRQVAVAVTRTDPPAGVTEPFLPEEGLPVEAALRAVTEGSAFVNGFESDSGRLEPGFRADCAVISGNPFTDPIHELEVDITILGGEIVHRTRG